MFGLGPTELIIILVIALLVLGPARIPDAAASLGKAIRSFRRATKDLRDQIDIDDEVRRPFEDLRAALRDEPAPHPLMPPSSLMTTAGAAEFPVLEPPADMPPPVHTPWTPPVTVQLPEEGPPVAASSAPIAATPPPPAPIDSAPAPAGPASTQEPAK